MQVFDFRRNLQYFEENRSTEVFYQCLLHLNEKRFKKITPVITICKFSIKIVSIYTLLFIFHKTLLLKQSQFGCCLKKAGFFFPHLFCNSNLKFECPCCGTFGV